MARGCASRSRRRPRGPVRGLAWPRTSAARRGAARSGRLARPSGAYKSESLANPVVVWLILLRCTRTPRSYFDRVLRSRRKHPNKVGSRPEVSRLPRCITVFAARDAPPRPCESSASRANIRRSRGTRSVAASRRRRCAVSTRRPIDSGGRGRSLATPRREFAVIRRGSQVRIATMRLPWSAAPAPPVEPPPPWWAATVATPTTAVETLDLGALAIFVFVLVAVSIQYRDYAKPLDAVFLRTARALGSTCETWDDWLDAHGLAPGRKSHRRQPRDPRDRQGFWRRRAKIPSPPAARPPRQAEILASPGGNPIAARRATPADRLGFCVARAKIPIAARRATPADRLGFRRRRDPRAQALISARSATASRWSSPYSSLRAAVRVRRTG